MSDGTGSRGMGDPDARQRTWSALQVRVTRASLLMLGITDEPAGGRLHLKCRDEGNVQPMLGPAFAPTDVPTRPATCKAFDYNVCSSASVLQQEQATLRAGVDDGVATLVLLDLSDDVAVAPRGPADCGESDLFKAVVDPLLAADEIVSPSVDLTLSRGLN